MEQMIDVLANKYDVDKSNPAWKSTLFNKLCLVMDIEQDLQEERKDFKEHEKKLNEIISEKMQYEIFLANTIANKDISSIFRSKLKRYAKQAGLKISYEQSSNSHHQ